MPETGYDAFISYRRSDGGAVARWLRRELQGFQLPRSLRGRSRTLKVYLDTAYERGTSDFYLDSIKPALLASRWLLVIATPNALRRAAGQDDWMQREVSDFAAGPHGGNVIAVRASGEFDGPLPADLRERFPNIEIVDLRGASLFSFLNPLRASRLAGEKLKLVAPLLELAPDDMPVLRQEEERRQQARLGATAGVTLGILLAVSFLSAIALQSRFRATRALESSMFATGRMVESVAGQMEREGGSKVLRRRLLNEGCDLIDKLRSDADREARIGELVTCRIERGFEYAQQKDDVLAKASFQQAVDLATERHAHTRAIDAALAIVRARGAKAGFLKARDETAEAEAELQLLLLDAKRLGAMHEGRHEFAAAEAEALGQRGDLLRRSDHAEAGRSYEGSAEAVERAIKASFGEPEARNVSWLIRLYRLAGEERRALDDADGALAQFARAVDSRGRIAATKITAEIELEIAHALTLTFDVRRQRGEDADASAARTEALAALGRVLNARDASTALKQRAQRIRDWIERQPAVGQGG